MSIMDEIRKQDLYHGDIDINSEYAINKIAEALCEYIFRYILNLNKNPNNSRKIYGYVLLSGDKIELDRFNRSLHIDKFSYEPYARNHFTNHPPFKCFISEVINKDIGIEAHVDYSDRFYIHDNNIFFCRL